MISPHSLRVALAGLAALPVAATAQLPDISFHETAPEFAGRADTDGNGLPDVLIVDKVSGSVRVAWQTAPGVFTWSEALATGLRNVTGAAAGHLLTTTRDTLAVTAPEENRVNLLALLPAVAPVPISVYTAQEGPNTLAVANLAGTIAADDLWIGSALNSSSLPGRFDQFINNPAGTLTFSVNRQQSAGQFDSADAVILKTGLTGTFAYLEHLPAGETLRVIAAESAGAPVRITLPGLQPESSWLIAPFNGTPLAGILTWVPGESTFQSRRIFEPSANTFSVNPPISLSAPFPVGQLFLVPTGSGSHRLLILSADATTAAWFIFDGSPLSAPVQTAHAAPGQQFTGAVPMPGTGGLHLLSGAAGDGRTASSRYLKWDDAAGQFADAGTTDFGPLGRRSGAGNVLLFAGEPFVSPDARLVSRLNARDWTSGTAPLPPAGLSLTGETFSGSALGLHDATAVNLGAPPAAATHVLLNQLTPALSLFSLNAASGATIGEPSITPDGGRYAHAIQLRFTAPPGVLVKFRDAGGAWTFYSPPGAAPDAAPGTPAYEAWWTLFRPLVRYQDTVIEFYGQSGSVRTAIHSAAFTFTESPDTLSSLHDRVPDYVKLGLHHNPFTPSALGHGDYLDRLLAPVVADPLTLSATLRNIYVRPMSLNGYDNSTRPSLLAGTPLPDGSVAPGNLVAAYDSGGVLLAGSDETPVPAGLNPGLRIWPPFPEPSARLSGLSGAGNGGFAILATAPNFAIAGALPPTAYPSSTGREIAAILPLPGITPDNYSRTWTGGTDAAEAAQWITGATAFYNARTVPAVSRTMDSLDTMALLLFERWVLSASLQRGLLPAAYTPPVPDVLNPPAANPDYLTLTAFRQSEAAHPAGAAGAGAVFPTTAQLQSLQSAPPPAKAWRLTDVISTIQTSLRDSADPDISSLRAVTRDVYRICSRQANEVRGGFPLPLDALREFLATGAVPAGYGNKVLSASPPPGAPYSTLTDAEYSGALTGVTKILLQISSRPWSDFDLLVRADTVQSGCTVLDFATGGGSVSLLGQDSAPFAFPGGFAIPPGAAVHVRAYTDFPPGPCGLQIQVATLSGLPAATVTSIPVPTPATGDNLLPDAWEQFFFGGTGTDPFASPPGSKLSYLQIYLQGKDPLNPKSYAGIVPVLTKLPALTVTPDAGDGLALHFSIPPQFAGKFLYHLQSSTGPDLDFTASPELVTEVSPGEFEILPAITPAPRKFWRMGFALK